MKILIADDHPMVRDALARALHSIEPEADIVEAGDYVSTEACLAAGTSALALIDLNMPGMDGLRGIQRLRERHPAVRLAVASGEDDPATIRSVLAMGVVAFIPKSEPGEVLLQALRFVLAGGTYLPPRALQQLHSGRPDAARPDATGLTPRQLDVLRLLMRGQPNKLIARELGLTEGTVKIHIASILRTLRARNRTEAVVCARELGLGP